MAGAASALTGPLLAAYPAVLLADTAVPAWHEAHRELPLLFVGGAMTVGGAAGLAASAVAGTGRTSTPAYRLAMIGVSGGERGAATGWNACRAWSASPTAPAPGGQMLTAARYLTISGGVVALAARRSRIAAAASAALLTGWRPVRQVRGAASRQGVGSDPKSVLASQRPAAKEPDGDDRLDPSSPAASESTRLLACHRG